jgi:hypothetical protein
MKTYQLTIQKSDLKIIHKTCKSFETYDLACGWADQMLTDISELSGVKFLSSTLFSIKIKK